MSADVAIDRTGTWRAKLCYGCIDQGSPSIAPNEMWLPEQHDCASRQLLLCFIVICYLRAPVWRKDKTVQSKLPGSALLIHAMLEFH